jgi:2-oxoglutarate dehydrogenase E1 component
LYENYLNDPTSVSAEWRDYFDHLAQMPGFVARDVAHAPVIAAFAELAKDGGFRQARRPPRRPSTASSRLLASWSRPTVRWVTAGPISIRSSACRVRSSTNWSRRSTASPMPT